MLIAPMLLTVAVMVESCTNCAETVKELTEDTDTLVESVETTGEMALDFTATDSKGETFSLSDYRGERLVVIDFWGSWCGWCMKGVPDMKEAYARHSDKVEFIGINCYDDEKTFRSTVAAEAMPWRHVHNDSQPESLAELYGVDGYPTKIIVGLNGEVIERYEGEDPAFYERLDELCK